MTGIRSKLLEKNGEGTPRFPGTKGRLVRLAQKILDRCIFIFFCEDMGQALAFPPKLLQDFLVERSNDAYFDPDATTIWQDMLRLFTAMNDGRAFGGKKLNQFNGGLFAADESLDKLHVPNSIFCQHLQGATEANLYSHKKTVLYLCASYNFASDLRQTKTTNKPSADNSKSIGLYMLGRVFEQSITELEILEAEADGRVSLNKESKRKRDGVYYTPEWVVERIVDETLGPRLAQLKVECGWSAKGDPSPEAIEAYANRLKTLTILDPACGSGAFLITVLRYLVDEWHEVQGLRRQITKGRAQRDDDDGLIADILKSNIYGVDINAASVEISRLALWLHTARGDKPLSSLDENIREGNSLIDSEFFKGQAGLALYDAAETERVNAFDWAEKFPTVFNAGGFDVIVGNPPYVKLQNFRTVHSDMAEYLRDGRNGVRPYVSTQTGNFDLYVSFIEKGIRLLNENGRLGYIAQSVWTTNDYGAGLREFIDKGQYLDRWIDFKSYQVFDEAITYTALQFFTKQPNKTIRVAEAPNGVIPGDPWSDVGAALPYGQQVFGDRWLLLTGEERRLLNRLYSFCRRLDDPKHTTQIFQGLITSADAIYHLSRLGPGRYVCTPKGDDAPLPYEVEIEEELMKPLVSGPEAKRYIKPSTATYILFPYQTADGDVKLIPPDKLKEKFPKAWKYLGSYKEELRLREAKRDKRGELVEAPFNDTAWYRFGRSQGLDKQEIQKLIVAQTVPEMRVCFDADAEMYLNNVRVNGIICAEGQDPWFLLGILNSRIVDFVFRRIAKVKAGGFFEANKQFIAPLPIPPAELSNKESIAEKAKALQVAHSEKRRLLGEIDRRLSSAKTRAKPETWLFAGLKGKSELLKEAPSKLDTDQKKAWAEQRYDLGLQNRYDAITPRLVADADVTAQFADGELSLAIDGVRVVEKIFVSPSDGEFIVAQWKVLAGTFSITEKTDGKKFANAFRKLVVSDNAALVKQVIDLEKSLSTLEDDINQQEIAINQEIEKLYQVSGPEEVLMGKAL